MIELIISLLLFALLHSWMAASSFKQQVSNAIGDSNFKKYYRLIYNIFSVLSFLPSFYFANVPSTEMWHAKGYVAVAMVTLQFLAAVFIFISVKQIDWKEFLGTRQLNSATNIKTEHTEPLVVTGLYKYVRHPLYIFSMLLIWFRPVMTLNWFIFCFGCTLYFIVGSYFEEIKLQRVYGSSYAEYKQNAFWFF